jgi:hypothetical protein
VPRELAGLPEPRSGDKFTTAGGREHGQIVSVDRWKHLTGTIMGAFMSYVLPEDQRTTRLLLKVVIQTTRWITPALCVGDPNMARRQLLNLKQLTEHHLQDNVAVDQFAGSVTVTGKPRGNTTNPPGSPQS